MQSGAHTLERVGWSLAAMTDGEVEAELGRLVRANTRTEALIVAHLAEVEARRLHLQAGFDSMFQYCLEQLKLGDFEAFLRINAARVAARYPVVLDLLERQEIHLTAIRLLREHLTDDNHRELLAEACGKSKRQVEALLANRFPRPDVPERLRRLPKLEPLSPGRYRLELTIDEELKEKLELARDLMSHANPRGDLSIVVKRAAKVLVEQLLKARFGRANRPRGTKWKTAAKEHNHMGQPKCEVTGNAPGRSAPATAASCPTRRRRRIRNAVRRELLERDGLRCSYVSANGMRCSARAFLQLDHELAWSKEGSDEGRNLRILCRAHNLLLAEREFGHRRVKQTG